MEHSAVVAAFWNRLTMGPISLVLQPHVQQAVGTFECVWRCINILLGGSALSFDLLVNVSNFLSHTSQLQQELKGGSGLTSIAGHDKNGFVHMKVIKWALEKSSTIRLMTLKPERRRQVVEQLSEQRRRGVIAGCGRYMVTGFYNTKPDPKKGMCSTGKPITDEEYDNGSIVGVVYSIVPELSCTAHSICIHWSGVALPDWYDRDELQHCDFMFERAGKAGKNGLIPVYYHDENEELVGESSHEGSIPCGQPATSSVVPEAVAQDISWRKGQPKPELIQHAVAVFLDEATVVDPLRRADAANDLTQLKVRVPKNHGTSRKLMNRKFGFGMEERTEWHQLMVRKADKKWEPWCSCPVHKSYSEQALAILSPQVLILML
jgi:hypothetical protein